MGVGLPEAPLSLHAPQEAPNNPIVPANDRSLNELLNHQLPSRFKRLLFDPFGIRSDFCAGYSRAYLG